MGSTRNSGRSYECSSLIRFSSASSAIARRLDQQLTLGALFDRAVPAVHDVIGRADRHTGSKPLLDQPSRQRFCIRLFADRRQHESDIRHRKLFSSSFSSCTSQRVVVVFSTRGKRAPASRIEEPRQNPAHRSDTSGVPRLGHPRGRPRRRPRPPRHDARPSRVPTSSRPQSPASAWKTRNCAKKRGD